MSVAPKWRARLHAPRKNCRHRGSDEGDAPLLVDWDVAPGEGEVVIGGEQGDQAEGEAADRLGEAEAIEGGPRRGCCWQFWRNRRLLAAGWRPGGTWGRGHGAGAETGGEGSKTSMPPAGSDRHRPQLPQGIQTPSPCIRWKRRNGVAAREVLP